MRAIFFMAFTLVALTLQAASFRPWQESYGLWLPPTLRGEPPPVTFVSGYPFEAPSPALDTRAYTPLKPSLSPLDFLAGNIAFFSKDTQHPTRSIVLSVGNSDYPLPQDIALDPKTVFPVEGLLQLSSNGPTLLWNSYAPPTGQANVDLAEFIVSLRLTQPLYPVRLYLK